MQIRIDWKILIFVLFFFIFKTEYIYLLFLLFILIHELTHVLVGIIVGFEILRLNISPFGCYINFKINIKNYNKKILKGTLCSLKKIIVAIAGPFANLLIAVAFYNSIFEYIVYINLILAIFNILPIYPLDGGRILKQNLALFFGRRKALKYTDIISNVILIILIFIIMFFSIMEKNIILLMGIVYLVYIRIKEHRIYLIKERIYRIKF